MRATTRCSMRPTPRFSFHMKPINASNSARLIRVSPSKVKVMGGCTTGKHGPVPGHSSARIAEALPQTAVPTRVKGGRNAASHLQYIGHGNHQDAMGKLRSTPPQKVPSASVGAGRPPPAPVSSEPADKGYDERYLTITKRSDVSWREALAKGFTGRL